MSEARRRGLEKPPEKNLTLVVLAAGVGSRFGGCKQLEPIGPNGETLLEYSAYDARRAGFDRVVVVVHPETEAAIRTHLDRGMARRLPVTYVAQRLDDLPLGVAMAPDRAKPWGTAHAVLVAASALDGPFAVVNAGDFYGAESYVTLANFLSAGGSRLAAIGFRSGDTVVEDRPVSRALLEIGDGGLLRQIVEIREMWRHGGRIFYRDPQNRRQELDVDRPVSMNIWGFGPGVVDELRRRFIDFLARSGNDSGIEFLLPDVIESMIQDQCVEVEVLPAGGEWCGITHRDDQRRARLVIASLVRQGRYPEELWA